MEQVFIASDVAKLLDLIGNDREQAGEEYESLRQTLTRFFEWRGAPFPEEQTDETFNRVARKLDQGIEIHNIRGYFYEVARLVSLEALKGRDAKRSPLEPEWLEAKAAADEATERELYLACLDDCLELLSFESRELITSYYRDEKRGRIDHRKALAERLGLRRDALANRAQRFRDKIESCVRSCVGQKTTI